MNLKRSIYYWRQELKKAVDLRNLPARSLEEATSINELQRISSANSLHGFNGQVLRIAYLAWLYRQLECTSFLETGTRYGYTAITMQRLLGGPVFSVELMKSNYWRAKTLAWLTFGPRWNFRLTRGDSRTTLQQWLNGDLLGARPMIYLDAHFYEDFPLVAELDLAIRHGSCVVVIDDFKVPSDAGFGWDHKRGYEIAMDTIFTTLPKSRTTVLYPSHSATAETGSRRGTCILLIDLKLPTEGISQFPAELFREVKSELTASAQ